MKMIVAVVRDEYAASLADKLVQKGFGATKLASTGGFLRRGSSTFLIGVPAEQLEEALEVIRTTCPSRSSGTRTNAADRDGLPGATEGSGATVFILNVPRMVKV